MKARTLTDLARARQLATNGDGKRIRKQAGLSGAEVARGIDISTSTLWRWEAGQRAPHGPAALRWVALLDQLQRIAS